MDKDLIFNVNKEELSKKEFFFCNSELIITKENIKEQDKSINKDSINVAQTLMLVNEMDIGEILDIEDKNNINRQKRDYTIEGVRAVPLYLFYDKDKFEQLISSKDITAICRKHRIVIIVGEEALWDFFAKWDTVLPTNIYGNQINVAYNILQYIFKEKTAKLQDMYTELIAYYDSEEANILERIRQKKQKICVIKYYYEPVRFKYLYTQFEASVEKAGCEVHLCMERANIYHTPDIVNIYKYRPDMVFQINKSRNGRNFGGLGLDLQQFKKLVYVNWIQDIHPAVLNREYAQSLGDNDYIFSLFDKKVMDSYCFEDSKVITGGIMGADGQNFCYHNISEEEHKKYDCDIVFVGNIMTDAGAADYIYMSLIRYFNDSQVGMIADSLFEALENIYDEKTGRYITTSEMYKRIDLLQEKMGFDYDAKMNIHRVFSVVRYNSMRKLIMQQLAKCGRYNITLYGQYDANISGVKFGGYIDDKAELSKALQCSKIAVQINPEASMNQRVIEALLSHTMVLVLQVEKDSEMSDIHNYLDEGEGIHYFSNKQQLFDLCDLLIGNDTLRNNIAEKGYNRAIKELTTDAIFSSFIDNLSRRI